MNSLEDQIKALAIESGATTCGIASKTRLMDAPPSADPTYVLESAKSVIAYSIAFDDEILADFMAKRNYQRFVDHKKDLEVLLYRVGDKIAEFLIGLGHEAVTVSINSVYRPEPGKKDMSEAIDMFPDFSHRYAAVAAGLGRVGWSGNVLTPEYGAAVELCSVITSAELKEDPLLEENPCDGCRSCVATCPVSMIEHRKSKTIKMFGLEDEIAEKRNNMACYMGCSDYHGLAPNGKWSNWSPYRQEGGLPDDDKKIEEMGNASRRNDPRTSGFFGDYRTYITDPNQKLHSVCGNCSYVCNGPSPKRNRARQSILKSGCVVLRVTGERDVIKDSDLIIEIPTQFGENIAMLKEEVDAVKRGELEITPNATENVRDKLFLEYFRDKHAAMTV